MPFAFKSLLKPAVILSTVHLEMIKVSQLVANFPLLFENQAFIKVFGGKITYSHPVSNTRFTLSGTSYLMSILILSSYLSLTFQLFECSRCTLIFHNSMPSPTNQLAFASSNIILLQVQILQPSLRNFLCLPVNIKPPY